MPRTTLKKHVAAAINRLQKKIISLEDFPDPQSFGFDLSELHTLKSNGAPNSSLLVVDSKDFNASLQSPAVDSEQQVARPKTRSKSLLTCASSVSASPQNPLCSSSVSPSTPTPLTSEPIQSPNSRSSRPTRRAAAKFNASLASLHAVHDVHRQPALPPLTVGESASVNADVKPALRSKLPRPHSISNSGQRSLHKSLKYSSKMKKAARTKVNADWLKRIKKMGRERRERTIQKLHAEGVDVSPALEQAAPDAETASAPELGSSDSSDAASASPIKSSSAAAAPSVRPAHAEAAASSKATRARQAARERVVLSRKRKASKSPARHLPVKSNGDGSSSLVDAAAGALVASPGFSLRSSDSTLLTLADELYVAATLMFLADYKLVPTTRTVSDCISHYLCMRHPHEYLTSPPLFSSETVRRFISKHHSLFSIASRPTYTWINDIYYVDPSVNEAVRAFFSGYKELLASLQEKGQTPVVWSLDQVDLPLDEGDALSAPDASGLVALSPYRARQRAITIYLCGNSRGEFLPPFVLSTSEMIRIEWTFSEGADEKPELGARGIGFSFPEASVMDPCGFVDWLESHFVANLSKLGYTDGTHVLLVDAQKVVLPARNSLAALLPDVPNAYEVAAKHGVHLVPLPSDAPHIMSPVSLAVNDTLRDTWRKLYSEHQAEQLKPSLAVAAPEEGLIAPGLSNATISALIGRLVSTVCLPPLMEEAFRQSGLLPPDEQSVVHRVTAELPSTPPSSGPLTKHRLPIFVQRSLARLAVRSLAQMADAATSVTDESHEPELGIFAAVSRGHFRVLI